MPHLVRYAVPLPQFSSLKKNMVLPGNFSCFVALRVLILQSIQRLLRHEASSVRLDKFSGHFFDRVKIMLRDVDATVSR